MAIHDSVLITGGKGMLAAAFAHVLQTRGIKARFADRDTLDITDAPAVAAAFARHKPTLVINCAAYTKVDLAEKEPAAALAINGTAVGHLAAACRDAHAALVHYSTDYVFDGTLSRPLQPHDPVGPRSEYGKSKLAGEQLLQAHAPARWLILRTAWLYGPGGPNFPNTMLNAARANRPLTVIDDQIGSPTFTRDLAAATLDLLDANCTGIYHLANSGQASWFDLAGEVLAEFKQPAVSLSRTTSAAWKLARPDSAIRPAYSVLDTTPYTQATGKTMPHWRDALTRYRQAVTE